MLVTADKFGKCARHIERFDHLNADMETTGLRPYHGDRICGVVIATHRRSDPPMYFPFRHEIGPNLNSEQLSVIMRILSKRVLTGWNFKFDLHMMMQDGFPSLPKPGSIEDLMLAAHSLDENAANHKLKAWGTRLLGPKAAMEELVLIQLLADNGMGKGDMWKLPPRLVTKYACNDVDLTRDMRPIIVKGLEDWRLFDLWLEQNNYELATVEMERRGLLLDVPLIKKYIKEADRKIAPARVLLEKMAGYPINPQSNPQVQAYLGLPSAAKDVLEPLLERGDRPDIQALVDFRAWNKVNNTYYLPYTNEWMDPHNIVHASLSLIGTETGRMACFDPNLQAIPRMTEAYKVKNVFIARPGYLIVSCDYSQAELRVGGHYANEPELLKIMNAGGDLHQEVADITGLVRDAAKRIDFGAFYGLGGPGLSRQLKISEEEARDFLEMYHGRFQGIRPLYRSMTRYAFKHGYIRLWSGRVRHYTGHGKAQPHKAMSNLIQGGVGEVMRKVITGMHWSLKPHDIHMLLQVHDQVVFEIPDDGSWKRSTLMIRDAMQYLVDWVPEHPPIMMVVDIGVGRRLGKLKEVISKGKPTWRIKNAA